MHSYPPDTLDFTILSPVILLPESTVIPIVAGFTPESSSVTLNVIVGLLFVSTALAVGYVITTTGATFSFTFSLRLSPNVS